MAGTAWGMKADDRVPQPFVGTQTGIQGMFDYIGVGGRGHIGPGDFTGLTNLTMYAKCEISGSGPLGTLLTRSPSATGTFLREKTSAEGNPSGATGIVLRGLGLYGNGSAGDGLNLGNQVAGNTFNSLAYLSDILVRDFLGGKGIILHASSISSRNVWSLNNEYGLYLSDGEQNNFYGLWLEGNTKSQLWTTQWGDNFFGTHLEDNNASWDGVSPTIDLENGAGGQAINNFFHGISIHLPLNRDKLIILRSGISRNCFTALNIIASGGVTWNHTFYSDAWSNGTGPKKSIPWFIDMQGATDNAAYIRDSQISAGFSTIEATGISLARAISSKRFVLTDAATIAVDAARGNYFTVTLGGNRTMGAPTNPVDGQKIEFKILQDGTGGRTLAWDTAFKTNWADTGNTLGKFSTIAFRYDATNWHQVGAQSAYI